MNDNYLNYNKLTLFFNKLKTLFATKEEIQDLKGEDGATPVIKAGTATSLDADASPTVSASTNGITTTFNFGIPKGDTSDIKTPVFTDTVSTYTTLNDANTAAETTSNAIKSNVSIFTTLTNIKRSFSAIVQGLKILATNVGAIDGITSDINSESDTIAASSKMVHDLNSSLVTITHYKYKDVTITALANSSSSNVKINENIKIISTAFIYTDGFYYLKPVAAIGGDNKSVIIVYNPYQSAQTIRVRISYIEL